MAMMKNIGTSVTSQKMKNRKRSRVMNVPITPVMSMRKRP